MRGTKFCSFRNRRVRQSGFSLIELAIVLVIIMSVLTLGMGALNSLMTSSSYSETKGRQARIKDALIAYYGAHKRMPCPAWGSATPDMRGVEQQASGACVVDPVATPAPPPGFGVVPYVTLGLGRDVAEDGWGNLMSYQVYFQNAGTCPGTRVDWTTSACFGSGKKGGLWVYDGGLHATDPPPEGRAIYDTHPPATDSRAVVVIVSHGKNGFGAWTRQGTQNIQPPTSSCEERMNSDRSALGAGCSLPGPAVPVPQPTVATTFIIGERPENDDVVANLTADDVIQRLAKQGDILSATAQMIEDKYKIISSSEIAVSSTCLPTVTSPSSVLDPWGQPYTVTGSSFPITISGGTPTASVSITLAEYKRLTGNNCTPSP